MKPTFCQCDLCKKIAKKHKYPKCDHCGKHHDSRLCCPEMMGIIKKGDWEEFAERVKKLKIPIITSTQKESFGENATNKINIDPKDCDYYIELEKGKYTVYQEKQGSLKALRYGEPWQDLCGNNLIFYLMVNLIEAKDKLGKIMKVIGLNDLTVSSIIQKIIIGKQYD